MKQHCPKTAASATQRPHLSVVCLLKNFASRLCRSARCVVCSRETRLCRAFFVSSTVAAIFFCCGQRCQLRCANLAVDPCNPCCVCFAALRCVARGRILRDPEVLGKGFPEIIRIQPKNNANRSFLAAPAPSSTYRVGMSQKGADVCHARPVDS